MAQESQSQTRLPSESSGDQTTQDRKAVRLSICVKHTPTDSFVQFFLYSPPSFATAILHHPVVSLPTNLQNFPHNATRLAISSQQLLALLPLLLDPVVLVQQIAKQILLVQFADQPILHRVLAVVDQQVHDRFRNRVGDGLAHDVEVGGDETADELRFEGFALGEF